MPCPRAELIECYCRENTTTHGEGSATLCSVARPCYRSHHPAGQDTARCRRSTTNLLNADEASPALPGPIASGQVSQAFRGARVSSATDAAHYCLDGVHRAQATRRGLTLSPICENTRLCA